MVFKKFWDFVIVEYCINKGFGIEVWYFFNKFINVG